MIYLYLFGTCFHFIYVFMIIGNIRPCPARFVGVPSLLGKCCCAQRVVL